MKRIGLLLACSLLTAMTEPSLQGIYGKDDRQEIYEVNDPAIRRLADSTMAMFSGEWLTPNGAYYDLKIKALGEYYNLCPKERFWHQPASADCSAALIGPDIVLTAGHCIKPEECLTKFFAFGYKYSSRGQNITQLPASNVYSCRRVVFWADDGELDFAIVQLDREADRAPLKVATRNANLGSSVFMLGFPLGLPMKYSGQSRVMNQTENYFVTNLDTFTGNSGSPVFSMATKEIVGVLVRGNDDFVPTKAPSCSKINYCKNCNGEDVTNIQPIQQYLFESK